MNVVVPLEHRFLVTPDGTAWTQGNFSAQFWHRYLAVFDKVAVVGRAVKAGELPSEGWKAVNDAANIEFRPMPNYQGPQEFIANYPSIRKAVQDAIGPNEASILRLPGQVGTMVLNSNVESGRPYGVEIVGDPWDVYAPAGTRNPLRPFFRRAFSRRLRQQIEGASGAAYVTSAALQTRYPVAPGAFSTHYSSIELRSEHIVSCPRHHDSVASPVRGVFVGTLAQLYKAPDVLLEAIRIAVNGGIEIDLTIVGDGQHRPKLEQASREMGVGQVVHFLGHLPAGDSVRQQLDAADLFILPSRQEGLPRAMIEAMARALPCIGTKVGGIPELLEPEDLVEPNDAAALAAKIVEVIKNPERLSQMSARNLTKANEFRDETLQERRTEFYAHIRESTCTWIRTRGTAT